MRLILFLFLFPFIALGQETTIEGHFSKGLHANFNILYRYTENGTKYLSTVKAPNNGVYTNILPSNSTKGFYKIAYAAPVDSNFIHFYFDGKNNIQFSVSSNRKVHFSDETNHSFYVYLNKRKHFIKRLTTLLSTKNVSLSPIRKLISMEQKNYAEAIKKTTNKDLSYILNAIRIYFPDTVLKVSQLQQFWKYHYLNHFDFNDSLLMASPFPLQIIKEYFLIPSQQQSEHYQNSVINQMIKHISQSKNDLFKFHLLDNFQKWLVTKEQDKTAKYLIKRYLLPFAKGLHAKRVVHRLQKYLTLARFTKVPNFRLTNAVVKNIPDSLYDVRSSHYYILAFWSSTCPHCQKQMPQLNNIIEKIDTNFMRVIAVGLEYSNETWKKEIKQLPNFINTYITGKRRTKIDLQYGIKVTPTYILLNQKKEVLDKLYSIEAIQKKLMELNQR